MDGMKERPILFGAPMVRAILDGTKTQTRRVVKPQPEHPHFKGMLATDDEGIELYLHDKTLYRAIRSQYGKPGDRLWVRENGWQRPERTPKMMREGADTWAPYYFDADYEFGATRDNEFSEFKEWGFKRRPSIHMPRAFSRILLEIVSVRVERLQEISGADCVAEGISANAVPDYIFGYQEAYRDLWERINGIGSWSTNPFVWVVEFRRIEQ